MTSILKVDTIQDADGNNIINESGNTITIGASGDTTNIVGTLQNNGAGVGGTMTPAFSAYMSGDTSLSDETNTTLVINTEIYDSGSVFNTSNYRFTPGETGKYLICGGALIESGQNANFSRCVFKLKKNGSDFKQVNFDHRGNPTRSSNPTFQHLVNVTSTSDYFSLEVYLSAAISGSGLFVQGGSEYTYFNGFKIIE